ncbi:DUF2235 domain-containing protein, partial [Vibrio parahaemolyticus]|nr:DUF2235 domain-containing protein [Vibrio parahaemolyticus]
LKTPSLDFKKLNQRVLDLAKQGEYVTLEETLTDVNLKKELMKLNLFHHSSGDDIGMAPLWDEAGNCYKRASYDCVEGE